MNTGPADAPYSGEEYNKPDPITRKYMFEIARAEGIILDPTYTGKAPPQVPAHIPELI